MRTRSWMIVAAALSAAALSAAPSEAQTPAGLDRGAAIRATVQPEGMAGSPTTLTANFADLTPERLRFTLGERDPRVHEVPLSRLVRLEVAGDRSALRGAGKGALYGGAIAAGLFLVSLKLYCADTGSWMQCDPDGNDYFRIGMRGAGMGAALGAAIGALIGSKEWREVELVTVPRDAP